MEIDQYIKEFQNGDFGHFEDFYHLTSKRVFYTALAILKTKESAEDIVQETFISFIENIQKYKIGANVYAYLTVIARNKSINVYNREKRLDFDEDELNKASYNMDTNHLSVEEILSNLKDETDREIVTYHIICGYKFREIGKIINMPLGTVLWRYNKALKILEKEVKCCEA